MFRIKMIAPGCRICLQGVGFMRGSALRVGRSLIQWNHLIGEFYPNGVFKQTEGAIVLRIHPQICRNFSYAIVGLAFTGVVGFFLLPKAEADEGTQLQGVRAEAKIDRILGRKIALYSESCKKIDEISSKDFNVENWVVVQTHGECDLYQMENIEKNYVTFARRIQVRLSNPDRWKSLFEKSGQIDPCIIIGINEAPTSQASSSDAGSKGLTPCR